MVGHAHLNWRDQFARAAARDRDKARLLHEQYMRELEEAKQQQIGADHEAADIVFQMLASPASIAEFRVRLDRYDEATVTALMENEQQLEEVRRSIDGMLLQAHVLPDGRRVFRTRDGVHVFDEQGNAVGRDQLDPLEIDPHRPVWEDFNTQLQNRRTLEQHRTELLRFQEKIDTARERLDDPSLTQNELDELQRDLEANAPDSVRRRVPGGSELRAGDAEISGPRQAVAAVASPRALDQFVPQ